MRIGTPVYVSKFSTSTVHRAAGRTVTARVAYLPAGTVFVMETGFTDALALAALDRTNANTSKGPMREPPTITL